MPNPSAAFMTEGGPFNGCVLLPLLTAMLVCYSSRTVGCLNTPGGDSVVQMFKPYTVHMPHCISGTDLAAVLDCAAHVPSWHVH